MKKCPTCDREFDDAMRFCQTDGTQLVEAAPPVDPYKTMVARPEDIAAAIPSTPAPPAEEDVLQIPPVGSDPKKTMYASEDEIRSAMADADDPREPVMDLSPPAPAFLGSEAASPSEPQDFGTPRTTPPIPSPFGEPRAPEIEQPPQIFTAPEPEPPSFMQPEPPAPAFNPFNEPAPIAQADFSPTPAAPEQSRQPEQMQNPQYQPGSGLPAAGAQNKTLAIVSLVSGILGLTLCCGTLIPSLVAIITGFMARGKASSDPSNYGGGGLALGGLITGVLGLLAGIGYLIFVFFLGGMQLMMQGMQ